MRKVDPLLFLVLAVLLLAAGLAYLFPRIPGVKEMADQPSLKPQERLFPLPSRSIPIQGRERKLDLFEAIELENPVEATPASLEKGRRLFRIYCAVCHGVDGKGKGPITPKLTTPVPDLTGEDVREQPDGYLYTVIREGGASMPGQAEALSPREQWDIVNYLRKLQQKG